MISTSNEATKVLLAADNLVREKFKDKKDRGNHPYIHHLEYVLDKMYESRKAECGYDTNSTLWLFWTKCCIVGILHDILEDTPTTISELRDIGCDDEIIRAIQILTRDDDKKSVSDYIEYIKKVKENPIARRVKIADLESNMDITRLSKLSDHDLERLKKYFYSWKYLKDEYSFNNYNNILDPVNKLR